MWLHWENRIGSQARCAVLVSDKVDGDYTYKELSPARPHV